MLWQQEICRRNDLIWPFANLDQAIDAARDIWFNKVDVNGWLEAFAAHPQIGQTHLLNTQVIPVHS
ncbi:hypothetical protein CK203_021037 [Vitis vinifera]|uniref:Uncharacterized protein n=1 Tax=Vitis vinifera TaxID=29760 RepID=A0A438JX19_VITVI|nr:hypothetical protein CK203_021037 [Vitis vinifera]